MGAVSLSDYSAASIDGGDDADDVDCGSLPSSSRSLEIPVATTSHNVDHVSSSVGGGVGCGVPARNAPSQGAIGGGGGSSVVSSGKMTMTTLNRNNDVKAKPRRNMKDVEPDGGVSGSPRSSSSSSTLWGTYLDAFDCASVNKCAEVISSNLCLFKVFYF